MVRETLPTRKRGVGILHAVDSAAVDEYEATAKRIRAPAELWRIAAGFNLAGTFQPLLERLWRQDKRAEE